MLHCLTSGPGSLQPEETSIENLVFLGQIILLQEIYGAAKAFFSVTVLRALGRYPMGCRLSAMFT